MHMMKNLSAALVTALSMYIFAASPLYGYLEEFNAQRIESGRMINVSVNVSEETENAGAEVAPEPAPSTQPEELKAAVTGTDEAPEAAAPDPALTERLRAEQAAFESMLSYNQDTAYGRNGGLPV